MAYEPKGAWLPVDGAPYEVSDLGQVRRAISGKSTSKGRVLSSKPRQRDGYIPVVLSLGSRGHSRQALVHVLVAEAFLGQRPSPEHEVAHADGNPSNNRSDNLRWATHAENMRDMLRHGRSTRGARSGHAILTESQVKILRAAKGQRGKVSELARQFGVSQQTASDAATGRTWKPMEMANGL